MEFKSLTNIESSFRRIRLMLAVFTGCCALITGYALWSSYRFAEKQREKIYVLDKGNSLMLALSQDLHRTAPPRRGNTSGVFTSCSSRSPRRRTRSNTI